MVGILTLGLNPAYQRTLVFDDFRQGEVNRASEVTISIGGKGQQAAKACNILSPGSCVCSQYLGGRTGEEVSAMMDERSIPTITVNVQAPTRICTTIICRGEMTELIDPSGEINAAESDELLEKVIAALPKFHAVALCGTYPPGIDESLYVDIASNKGDAFLLLDGCRGVEATLKTGQVDMLKVNGDELRTIAGIDSIDQAAARCRETYGIEWVAVTDGPWQARLYGSDQVWTYDIPNVSNAINPLGAGDTCAGITLLKMIEGQEIPEAFKWGLAAASASCLHLEGGVFLKEDMERIYREIFTK